MTENKTYNIQMIYHDNDTISITEPLSDEPTVIPAEFLRQWMRDENDYRGDPTEEFVIAPENTQPTIASWNEDQATWVITYPTGDKVYIPQYIWGLATSFLDYNNKL